MSLADKFHSNRGAALALSTLLAVTSVAAPFNAEAQDAKAISTRPAVTQPANTNTAPAQAGPLAKAVLFSNEGIGFLFVQGTNDKHDYRPLLNTLRETMTQVNIPARVYGIQSSEKPESFVLFYVKGIAYNGDTVASMDGNNINGYKPDDIRNGRVSFEAKRAYEQAFGEWIHREPER
jgi:hypothetical protein